MEEFSLSIGTTKKMIYSRGCHMKKLWIFSAFLLICICGNVKAASECEATYHFTKTNNVFVSLGAEVKRNRPIYIAQFTNNADRSKSGPGFCVDPGKHTSQNDTYVLDTSGAIKITPTMAKAISWIKHSGSGLGLLDDDSQIKYIVAQIAIWQESVNANANYNLEIFEMRVEDAVLSFYGCTKARPGETEEKCKNIDMLPSSILMASSRYISSFRNHKSSLSTDQLCVYKSKTNSNYQRFVAECLIPTCPPDPDTPPTNPDPDTPQVCKPTVQVVGSPAVCSANNQTNYGYLTEKVVYDPNNCGDANEYGNPSETLGKYCTLHCLEQVQQYYPGGISGPISLGSNIVWPTSSATEKTVWGNLYSLRYTGTKTCRIVVATSDDSNPFKDLEDANRIVNQYRQKYDVNSCQSTLANAIRQANEQVTSANGNVNYAQSKLDAKQEDIARCKSDKTTCSDRWDKFHKCAEKAKAYEECISKGYANCGQKPVCPVQPTCDQYENCGSDDAEKQELDNAKSALERAKNQLKTYNNQSDECNTYVRAYNAAANIIQDLKYCLNYNYAPNDLYKFQSDTSVSYDDPEYGATYNLTGNTNFTCNGCHSEYNPNINPSTINDIYNELLNINNKEIIVTANTTYALPENGYRYINKKNNQPLKSPIGDVINVGYTFLPTSYNASVKKPYNLNIIVNSLGEDGKFTEAANNRPYTCNYSLTKTTSDECVCPEGTEHAGEDLSSIIYNGSTTSSPMTCADAQLKYCNANVVTYCPSDQNIEITSCLNSGNSYRYCVDTLCPNGAGDKFCPNDKSIKITACLNNGNSYQYCVDSLCNAGNVDYHCPAGTFNDGMDIKPCVFANIHMGLNQALQYCVDTVCPYTGGVNIIYRTISLRNPFPGKTAGVGLNIKTNQFSLDHYYGRYPGANWNSVDLVKKQILYNRNVEENAVYQKEPLYSFILDTNTIKKIRKYNDDQEKSGGYADFTLNCNSNGIACISNEFVRKQEYGMISGVCSKATHGDFYTCSER